MNLEKLDYNKHKNKKSRLDNVKTPQNTLSDTMAVWYSGGGLARKITPLIHPPGPSSSQMK